MKKYLEKFIAERGWDLEDILEVMGPDAVMNSMPLGVLVEAIVNAPKSEQLAIKTMIVRIDFVDGDVFKYFENLAKGLVA